MIIRTDPTVFRASSDGLSGLSGLSGGLVKDGELGRIKGESSLAKVKLLVTGEFERDGKGE